MLAKPALSASLDQFEAVAFEPKWDGFRCLAFHLSDGIVLQGRGRSRSSDPRRPEVIVDLGYAFPEVVGAVAECTRVGTVLDAEIVVQVGGRLDFPALSSRLRPRADSGARTIAALSDRLPATLLAFDLLAQGTVLLDAPFAERRRRLQDLAPTWSRGLRLTPSTEDPRTAGGWFTDYESAGVDGLLVKPLGDPYQPGKRAQWKVKHRRTADLVVAGWRPQAAKDGVEVVGSLLLGAYDHDGLLHYLGGTGALTQVARRALRADLARYALGPGDDHPWLGDSGARAPGGASRWGPGKAWHAVVPALVAEVDYDQLEGTRFRHPAAFMRWRPDRDPRSCGFDQFPASSPNEIGGLLGWAAP